MGVINFSEASARLKSVIDQVNEDADYTIIVWRDAPDAVVMSVDSFSSLIETVHLLKSPANVAHLAQSVEQYRAGRLQTGKLIDEEWGVKSSTYMGFRCLEWLCLLAGTR